MAQAPASDLCCRLPSLPDDLEGIGSRGISKQGCQHGHMHQTHNNHTRATSGARGALVSGFSAADLMESQLQLSEAKRDGGSPLSGTPGAFT